MLTAYKTDRGRRRETNEDALLVDQENGIFLLADGMGGHQAGEVASRLAVDVTYVYIRNNLQRAREAHSLSALLEDAVVHAHTTIREQAGTSPLLNGMGTTLVIMLIHNTDAYLCHIGDSRAYLLREGIRQVTRDHTMDDYLLSRNIMTRGQKSHILTQAVGTSEHPAPEQHHLKLQPGDIMLLCSDGLTDMLSDSEIETIVRRHDGHLAAAAHELIEAANDRGGKDNISVVLILI